MKRIRKRTTNDKKIIFCKTVSRLPLSERLKHTAETWKILTKNSEILQLVEGIQNTFHKKPA